VAASQNHFDAMKHAGQVIFAVSQKASLRVEQIEKKQSNQSITQQLKVKYRSTF
jgi:hypothetical protein